MKRLWDKAKTLDHLSKKVLAYLDPDVRKYCQMTREQTTIIIFVENAALATDLRFKTNELLNKFKQDAALKSIQHIIFKVRPKQLHTLRYADHHQKPLRLSRETAKLVKGIAETIQDQNLRQVMEKIATHIK